MPLSWDLLQYLDQLAGDYRQPPFLADALAVVDPRRSGSVVGTRVGAIAAFGGAIPFTVPRAGLYLVELSIFAFAGAVGQWGFFIDSAGAQALYRQDAVSTSQGWRWGPRVLRLEEGDIVQLNNVTALAVGDTALGSVSAFEVALG